MFLFGQLGMVDLWRVVELHRMLNEKPNVENTLLPDEMLFIFFVYNFYTNMYCQYILLFYWTLTVYLVPLGNQVEAKKRPDWSYWTPEVKIP